MSSPSSSDSEAPGSDAELLTIQSLEAALACNPADYTSHTNLLASLRRAKLRRRLRAAREAMVQRFPLTEQLWREWLEDEVAGASSVEDVDAIGTLYEQAVRDFLSVPLWQSYIEFLHAAGTPVDALRAVCERAVTSGGLHFWQGSSIWGAYRAVELARLSELSGDEKAVSEVRDHIHSLFRRQLSVVLANTADTLATYQAWEAVPPEVAATAAKSVAAATARLALETPLKPSDDPLRSTSSSLLAAYMTLLTFDEREGDPGRVIVAFERALAEFPFTTGLWLRYTRFLTTRLGCGGVAAAAFDRALRTCAWAGDLWAAAIRAAERSNAERVSTLHAAALAAPLLSAEDHTVVGLARMDAARRVGQLEPLRLAALAALDGADAAAGGRHFDSALRVGAYWAQCDGAEAKEVWEALLKRPAYGVQAEAWLAFAQQERAGGGAAAARRVFKRCYTRRLAGSGQEDVCLAWLRCEREAGTADDYAAAEVKALPILEEAAAARDAAEAEAAAAAARAVPLSAEEAKRMRRERDPNFKGAAAAAAARPTGKRGADEEAQGEARQQAKRPRVDTAQEATPSAPAAVRRSDSLTVFVKSLPGSATVDEVRALFVAAGVTPTAVRVPRDHATGDARGFAYVECASEADTDTALALEAPTVGGSVLVLARSKPPGAASAGGRGGRAGGGRTAGRGPPSSGRQHRRLDASAEAAGGAQQSAPARSNSDFRSLLLGKK